MKRILLMILIISLFTGGAIVTAEDFNNQKGKMQEIISGPIQELVKAHRKKNLTPVIKEFFENLYHNDRTDL